jgi:hypothetical protein
VNPTYLGVTLQRSTRLAINVDDDSVWVTGKVDPGVDLDLGHLLVDLGLQGARESVVELGTCDGAQRCTHLLLVFARLDVGLELGRD